MKKYKVGALLLLLVCAAAVGPAHAEEPYYFHKTGVNREHYMDDVNDCAELAGGVRVPHYQVYAYGGTPANNAIAAGVGSFFSALAEGALRRRMVSRIERTCMADKGYERRSIDKVSHAEIRKLDGQAKIDRMFALVSAEQPIGKVLIE
ncbi:hypothetical protein [Sphingobium subterraneum]|uniref:Uncharacterized protein n=1 Tax=Sphingobium subterraneum TaxID=627688 RepID=A0A841J6L6_9SPHN|nr:hypothetical protein [Sphingobium subterraneum]MBB6125166.1 hypothetical protein [Sphingobium subterraneum]